MDAATYKLSKERINKLKMTDYTQSHIVVALNLVLLIAAFNFFTSSNPFNYLLGVCLLALQMNHAYLIVHECSHGSFYKKSWMNNTVGSFFAFFALMPFYSRRYEHLTHHREAGSFNEPSTRRAMDRFQLIDPRMERFMTVCWKMWIPIFALNEHVMLWGLPFKEGMDEKTRNSAILTIYVYAGVLLGLFMIHPFLSAVGWVIAFLPAFYLYMMLVEFFNLPHHLSSPVEDIHGTVPYYEQAKYSRSCAPLPAPFDSLFALNFNYHVAHHLYPAVHWSKIPEAHQIMIECDPTLDESLQHELTINHNMRKQPLNVALKKYFDQQYKESVDANEPIQAAS